MVVVVVEGRTVVVVDGAPPPPRDGTVVVVVVVVVVDDDAVWMLIGTPCSSVAPTGTRVLMKTAPMATAAPMGAATHERQFFNAPRRIGISTRS